MIQFDYREAFKRATKEINAIIENNEFCEQFKMTPSCFTRDRKMGFKSVLRFLLNLPRRPLPIELDEYFAGRHISKQAFSKARKNIKSEAFSTIAQISAKAVLLSTKDCDDYRGYRVFAIDGSEAEVANTVANASYFGTRGSGNACRARVSALLHISTNIIAHAEIASSKVGERKLAKGHIEHLADFAGERDLIIFDRGYPAKELIDTLEKSGIKYLMRVQRSFSKEIDENPQSDFRLKLEYNKGILDVRVVRVILPTGEVENLITNLPESEFETACFKELYFMRWGIESRYHMLKNKLLVENFSGKSRLSIEQDFYASVCAANLISLAKSAADQEIARDNAAKTLKHSYQANEKLAIKKVRDRLLAILIENDSAVWGQMFDDLVSDIAKDRSIIRPGRSFPRPKDAHHRRKLCSKSVF